MAETMPAGNVSHFTLYSADSGVTTTIVRGFANSNRTRSNAASRGRIEVLDHFNDGRCIETRQPLVAIHQRPVE